MDKKTISKKRYENIHQDVLNHFGKYAGYSQQFLYKMERDLNKKSGYKTLNKVKNFLILGLIAQLG